MSEEKWGNQTLPGLTEEQMLSPYLNHIARCKQLSKNPEWLAKIRTNAVERTKDPRWVEKQIIKNKNLPNSPAYMEKLRAGIQRRTESTIWKENHAKAMSSEEKKMILSEKTTGNKNPFFKGIMIGVHNETGEVIKFCGNKEAEANGFSPGAINKCIHGKKPQYKGYTWAREEPTK